MAMTRSEGPPEEERVCYLSASPDIASTAPVRAVTETLRAIGLRIASASSTPAIAERPQDADIGIFILTEEPSATLAFEIGVMVGVGRPTLIITSAEVELPVALAELARLTWPIEPEALEFQLQTFLLSSKSRLRKRPSKPLKRSEESADEGPAATKTPPLLRLDPQWHRLLAGGTTEQQVGRYLMAAPFKATALEPLRTSEGKGVFVDAALWIPELEPLNPVIMEVKGARAVDPQAAVDQLLGLLVSSSLHLGVLVTDHRKEEPQLLIRESSAVVLLSAEMLSDLTPHGLLRRTLTAARNRLFHVIEG
jgi:hypothetical protein